MNKISATKIKSGIAKLQKFNQPRDEIEEQLKLNAVYSDENYKISDVKSILKEYKLKQIGKGIYNRVFRIENKPWIVKEGRWDLSIEIFRGKHVPLPARLVEASLSLAASYKFLPTIKEILKQYKEYLEFTQYFGYFEKEADYHHPYRDLLFLSQKNIRASLRFFKPEIEKEYNIKINGKLDEIFSSDLILHNFLPKEYLLIGESFSRENNNKVTSFIFQEFVNGKVLRDVPRKEQSKNIKNQLILLAYLILLMHMQIRLLPDTRPRYHFIEAYDWLTKTDNIMIADDKLVFIDTRWFWNTKTNIIRRGLFIPQLTINRCKSTLLKLLEY